MQTITHVSSHTLLRQAVANYEPWIRSRLGCALADIVIPEVNLSLRSWVFRGWPTPS